MNLIDWIVVGLAASGATSAWMHDGPDGNSGLFTEFRDHLSVWGTPRQEKSDWIRGKVARVLTCEYCLTFHAVFVLCLWYVLAGCLQGIWATLAQTPIHAFAIARIVTWGLELFDETI